MKSLKSAVVAVAVTTVLALIVVPALTPSAAAEPPGDTAAPGAPKAAATPLPKKNISSEATVATVNGVPITRTIFEYYVKANTGKTAADFTPEQRSQILDNLIRGELLSQQALKVGLDKSSDVASQVTLSRLQVLGEAQAAAYLKDKPPTDAQAHAEYDVQVAQMPKTQYHARHILVPTQGEAQVLIDQLNGGASFEELAKTKSIDSTKDQGGDLGWFAPSTMVQPFAAAVTALKKSETTQTPIQTPFGWHVIQLLDTRDETPPTFDSVKQRLQQFVQQKKIRAYQDELFSAATIKKTL
jgi:peptidyl-prolyl cis-trans isomerase C